MNTPETAREAEIEAIFERLRREVRSAAPASVSPADAPDSWRLARDEAPDVVVLDVMLPGLSGREVCRQLRAESDVKRFQKWSLSHRLKRSSNARSCNDSSRRC